MSRRNGSDTPKLDAAVRAREMDDIAWVLSDPRGRRLMWRVFSIAGIFRNSFTGNSETFFNEGKRAIGTTLLSDLFQATPGRFVDMQQEAVKQAQEDAIAADIERKEESDG